MTIHLKTLFDTLSIALPTKLNPKCTINTQVSQFKQSALNHINSSLHYWLGNNNNTTDESPLYKALLEWTLQDHSMLRPLLNPVTITSTNTQSNISIIQILVSLNHFQLPITQFICSLIMGVVDDVGLDPLAPNLCVLALSQIRWLPKIYDPKQFTGLLLNTLQLTPDSFIPDLLSAIPEIVPESTHYLCVSQILDSDLLLLNADLIPPTVLALTNLNVPSQFVNDLIMTITKLIQQSHLADHTPLLVQFILDYVCPNRNAVSIRSGRTKEQPSKSLATSTSTYMDHIHELLNMLNFDQMSVSATALTLEKLACSMRSYKPIYTAVISWLDAQILNQSSSTLPTGNDLNHLSSKEWLLLVTAGSIPISGKKDLLRLVRANIQARRISILGVSQFMCDFSYAIQSMHLILLNLAETLIKPAIVIANTSNQTLSHPFKSHPDHVDSTSALFLGVFGMGPIPPMPTFTMSIGAQILYSGLAYLPIGPRQDWMATIVELSGSGVDLQCSIALKVLIIIAKSSSTTSHRSESKTSIKDNITPFALFLRSLLPKLNTMSLHNVRLYFEAITLLGFANCASISDLHSSNTKYVSDVEMLKSKYLNVSRAPIAAIGALAAVSLLERYADPFAKWANDVPLYDVPTTAGNLAFMCLQAVMRQTLHMPRVLAMTLDELAILIDQGCLHEAVHSWLSGEFENLIARIACTDLSAFYNPSGAATSSSVYPNMSKTNIPVSNGLCFYEFCFGEQLLGGHTVPTVSVHKVTSLDSGHGPVLVFGKEQCHAIPSLIRIIAVFARIYPTEEALVHMIQCFISLDIKFVPQYAPVVTAYLHLLINIMTTFPHFVSSDQHEVVMQYIKSKLMLVQALYDFMSQLQEGISSVGHNTEMVVDEANNGSKSASAVSMSTVKGKSTVKTQGRTGKRASKTPVATDAIESASRLDDYLSPAFWAPKIRQQWPLSLSVYSMMAQVPFTEPAFFRFILNEFFDMLQQPQVDQVAKIGVQHNPTNQEKNVQASVPVVIDPELNAQTPVLTVDLIHIVVPVLIKWLVGLTSAKDLGVHVHQLDLPSGADNRNMEDFPDADSASPIANLPSLERDSNTSVIVDMVTACMYKMLLLATAENCPLVDTMVQVLGDAVQDQLSKTVMNKGNEAGCDHLDDHPVTQGLFPNHNDMITTGILSQPLNKAEQVVNNVVRFLLPYVQKWTPRTAVMLFDIIVRLVTIFEPIVEQETSIMFGNLVTKKAAIPDVPSRYHRCLYNVATNFLTSRWQGIERDTDPLEFFLAQELAFAADSDEVVSDYVQFMVWQEEERVKGDANDVDEAGLETCVPSTQIMERALLLNNNTLLPYFRTIMRFLAKMFTNLKYQGHEADFLERLMSLTKKFYQIARHIAQMSNVTISMGNLKHKTISGELALTQVHPNISESDGSSENEGQRQYGALVKKRRRSNSLLEPSETPCKNSKKKQNHHLMRKQQQDLQQAHISEMNNTGELGEECDERGVSSGEDELMSDQSEHLDAAAEGHAKIESDEEMDPVNCVLTQVCQSGSSINYFHTRMTVCEPLHQSVSETVTKTAHNPAVTQLRHGLARSSSNFRSPFKYS